MPRVWFFFSRCSIFTMHCAAHTIFATFPGQSFPLAHPSFHQKLWYSFPTHVQPASIFCWTFMRPYWQLLITYSNLPLIFLFLLFFLQSGWATVTAGWHIKHYAKQVHGQNGEINFDTPFAESWLHHFKLWNISYSWNIQLFTDITIHK